MRVALGLIAIVVCILLFGWWGLLSLIIVLPFIGWKARYDGPFNVKPSATSDYKNGMEFITAFPNSGRLMQDLLVKMSKQEMPEEELRIDVLAIVTSIKEEEYDPEISSDSNLLSAYVNHFSRFFPNWPSEYDAIKSAL